MNTVRFVMRPFVRLVAHRNRIVNLNTMWPWNRPKVSKAHAKAEHAIATSLDGGDSLPAWNAIWDLVQSSDAQGKQALLGDLREFVAKSVGHIDRDQARSFEAALDQSTRPHRIVDSEETDGIARHALPVPPSKELREQSSRDQIETHRSAMRNIGVRPGDGIPMWALYMTRRNKRSWG